jgi:hypothetical protein
MHAVVVKVTISDAGSAQKELQERVLPQVSQAPGLVAGYWTRADDRSNGLSMVIFDNEEAAQTMAERVRTPGFVPEAVTLDSVEVREVMANV